MKDKLYKLNKKRVDVIDVILTCSVQDKFYYWLKENNVLAEGKTFSLKKLARIFLADNPGLYKKYESFKSALTADIECGKYNAWSDED